MCDGGEKNEKEGASRVLSTTTGGEGVACRQLIDTCCKLMRVQISCDQHGQCRNAGEWLEDGWRSVEKLEGDSFRYSYTTFYTVESTLRDVHSCVLCLLGKASNRHAVGGRHMASTSIFAPLRLCGQRQMASTVARHVDRYLRL